MKKIILITITLFCAIALFSQQGNIGTNDPFMNFNPASSSNVTIQRNTNFQTAIKIIENYSLRDERRNIVNLSSFNSGIPVQINNLPWRDALDLLIKAVGVRIETRPGTYLISDFTLELEAPVIEYQMNTKMVRIHATFLNIETGFARQIGINWNTIYDGKIFATVGFGQGGALETENPMLQATGSHGWTSSRLGQNARRTEDGRSDGRVDVEAFLNFLEDTNKGSILSRPSVTILSGKEGMFQVGRDFSVRSLDLSGNTVETFYSAGIILNVKPTIIADDDFEAISLEVSVEDSDVIPGAISTIITKTQAKTDLMLFDGEEYAIGGMIRSSTVRQRGGIPILKDLPWWVFGLKYIFGYNYNTKDDRELIVILKVEIIDPVKERINMRESMRERFDIMRDEFKEIGDELGHN